jgi:hypothetical protein
VRGERRFVELKKMIDGATLRCYHAAVAAMSADRPQTQLLYRELDLVNFWPGCRRPHVSPWFPECAWRMWWRRSPTQERQRRVLRRAPQERGQNRHDEIARRGSAVTARDTHVPQASIYAFSAEGGAVSPIPTPNFRFPQNEITAVRAALAVLKTDGLAEAWNRNGWSMTQLVADTLLQRPNIAPPTLRKRMNPSNRHDDADSRAYPEVLSDSA